MLCNRVWLTLYSVLIETEGNFLGNTGLVITMNKKPKLLRLRGLFETVAQGTRAGTHRHAGSGSGDGAGDGSGEGTGLERIVSRPSSMFGEAKQTSGSGCGSGVG